jgi:hypothetical protein
MADLKPLGSEKLQGMDKINRILEISRYKETTPRNENINEGKSSEYTIKLSDGFYYGIVRETKGYILKHGVVTDELSYMNDISERRYYPSYSQAMKRLNIIASEVNRNTGNVHSTPLIGEQSEPKKKFILKTPKPKGGDIAPPAPDLAPPTPPAPDLAPPTPPAPDLAAPAPPMGDEGMPPAGDTGMPPAGDTGMPPMGDEGMPPMGDEGMPPMGDEGMPPAGDTGMPPMGDEGDETDGPVGLKTIQKLTGRLSQKIRSFDKEKGLDSQDIKYVVNSILSAIDLSNLDEDDKEDIMDKFDSFDEYGMGDEGDLDIGGEDDFGTDDEGMPPMGDEGMPPADEEIPSPTFTESRVEKVLSKYFNISENEKPLLEEKKKRNFLNEKLKKIKIFKEIETLSETIEQSVTSKKLMSENNVNFIGKTNKENLIFSVNGKQVKVTPRGRIL